MKCKVACILAAGMGERLNWNLPKGLLPVGSSTLVERSLDQLFANGIEKVVLVTGYEAQAYRDLDFPGPVEFIHNEDFQNSGSLYSLWCARESLTESYLLLESDLLYEPRAIQVLQSSPEESLILLSGFSQAGDEIYVETKGKGLVTMSKVQSDLGAPALGEFVGICKISLDLHQQMMDFAQSKFPKGLKYDYETDGLVGCSAKHAITCHLVEDLIWTEIDDASHLHRATQVILPALENGV